MTVGAASAIIESMSKFLVEIQAEQIRYAAEALRFSPKLPILGFAAS